MFHLEPISAWLTACGERAAIQRSSYATVVSNDHARGAASERARWSHQARHACKFVGSRHVTSSAVAQPRPPKVLTQPLESQSCLCLHPRGAETSGCFAFFNKCCSSCHLPLTIEWLDCDVATSNFQDKSSRQPPQVIVFFRRFGFDSRPAGSRQVGR